MPRKKAIPKPKQEMSPLEKFFPIHERLIKTVLDPLHNLSVTAGAMPDDKEVKGYKRVIDAALESYTAMGNGIKLDASPEEKATWAHAYIRLEKEVDAFRSESEFAAKKLDSKVIGSLVTEAVNEVRKQEMKK